jgi:lactate permease
MTSFWIALSPFLALFVLLIPLRMPAYKAAPIAYGLTIAIAFLVWDISWTVFAISVLDTLVVFLKLLLIVVFALLLLNVMIEAGALERIKETIRGITDDERVIAMLLAWGLIGFIEGIAGFGTPAVLAAPVLVYFGMRPFKAVVICLVGNSTAVPFGAAGTPVIVGFAGLGLPGAALGEAVIRAAVVHGLASVFITCFIVWIVARDRGKGYFKEFAPFAIFSALSFSIPFVVIARWVGPELPSIIGGFISMVLIAYAAHRGYLLPSAEQGSGSRTKKPLRVAGMARSVAPFAVMSVALILSRTVPGIREVLQSVTLSFGSVGGIEIQEVLTPLYTPYFYLAIAFVTALLVLKVDRRALRNAAQSTYERIRTASVVLIFILALTQLMLISETNPAGLPSMPQALGEGFADLLGGTFVAFSAFLGAMGSFMTGSATVSNLLFGALQADAAIALDFPVGTFLGLQLVGAGVGNMISLSNIAMAAAAAGVDSREGEIIRATIVPMLVICPLAGLILSVW